MPDLLQRICSDLEKRRRELRPAVEEYERLERALAALGGEAAKAPQADGRRTRGRPRGRRAVGRGERVKQLLPLLKQNPDITASELAARLGTTRSNVSVTLSRLGKQGVVGRDGKRWVVRSDGG